MIENKQTQAAVKANCGGCCGAAAWLLLRTRAFIPPALWNVVCWWVTTETLPRNFSQLEGMPCLPMVMPPFPNMACVLWQVHVVVQRSGVPCLNLESLKGPFPASEALVGAAIIIQYPTLSSLFPDLSQMKFPYAFPTNLLHSNLRLQAWFLGSWMWNSDP